MTKEELLREIREMGACEEGGPAYVLASPLATAREIGLACDRVDLLVWYLGRREPEKIATFARNCADRAKGYAADCAGYAGYAADRAARASDCAGYAAAAAAACRAACAHAACAHAACAYARASLAAASHAYRAALAALAAAAARAADCAAEKEAQLAELHALWAERFPV